MLDELGDLSDIFRTIDQEVEHNWEMPWHKLRLFAQQAAWVSAWSNRAPQPTPF